MFKQVALPPERYAQLERYADAMNVSLAEAVAVMFRHEIEAGRMPADIPGITVERTDDKVLLVLAGEITRELPPAVAEGLADTLERLASPTRQRAELNLDANLKLERRGRGVIVTDIYTHRSYSIALSVARDLAPLIRKAVA